MSWIVYVICGILVILAVIILVKEIRKMIKGKCCEDCKHCSVRGDCSAVDKDKEKSEVEK